MCSSYPSFQAECFLLLEILLDVCVRPVQTKTLHNVLQSAGVQVQVCPVDKASDEGQHCALLATGLDRSVLLAQSVCLHKTVSVNHL